MVEGEGLEGVVGADFLPVGDKWGEEDREGQVGQVDRRLGITATDRPTRRQGIMGGAVTISAKHRGRCSSDDVVIVLANFYLTLLTCQV